MACATGCDAAILSAGRNDARRLDVRFPVPQYYQDYAAREGNPRPTTGRLLLLLPPNFDSRKVWPLLIVTATTDHGHTSPTDAPYYGAAAAAEGWVVLATDATIRPRQDSVAWRLALLIAGLQLVHRDWPQSAKWPVVLGGFSGGAKCTEWLGAIMAQTHSANIRGLFLGGINDDRMPAALQSNPAPPEFRAVPIWISSGIDDRIAPPPLEEEVAASLRRGGFSKVHLSRFRGGHELNRADLQSALKWFRAETR